MNAETREVTTAFTEEGSASHEADGADMAALKYRALYSAAANVSNRIREELAGKYMQVEAVNKDIISLNRGEASGVREGDFFYVYPADKTIKDSDAIICVTGVTEASSNAEVAADKTGHFSAKAGMRLAPGSDTDMLTYKMLRSNTDNQATRNQIQKQTQQQIKRTKSKK